MNIQLKPVKKMRTRSLLTVIAACLFAFTACDKEEMGPVMSTNPGSPTITAPESGQSYTLDEEQADETLLTMEWTEPDYGFPSAPTFIVQMDEAGDDFGDPIRLGSVNGTSYSVTVGEMNSMLLGAGLPSGEASTLEFRVMASLSDSLDKQVSEPISLAITPYSVCKYCPAIYVPGGYQAASGYGSDWTPGDAPALGTVDDTDRYEGYVYMANGSNAFKFTADQSWATNWGDNGADGTLEQNGANINAAESGFYKMYVDLNAMTYTLTPTQWGIIGSATANGWDSDQDMTYDPQARVWTITTDLSAGDIKFRANDAWDINYGDNGGDGTLELNGSNISIASAGNYTITLDLHGTEYTYTVTQN